VNNIKGEIKMNPSRSIKQMTAIILIIILPISSLVNVIGIPTTKNMNNQYIDQENGIYFQDDFNLSSFTDYDNTSTNNLGITLDPKGSTYIDYNFKDWTTNSENRFYIYRPPFFTFSIFFPINLSINFFEKDVNNKDVILNIVEDDDYTYPFWDNPKLELKNHVHHFKFKINENIEDIDKIKINWIGNYSTSSGNYEDISMYVWNQQFGQIGRWDSVDDESTESQEIKLEFEFNDRDNYPLTDDSYIHVSIVLAPSSFSDRCQLYTNFFNIRIYGDHYSQSGYVLSQSIKPLNINNWGYADWKHNVPANTEIKYHMFYLDNDTYRPIEEEYISNNFDGFETGPVDLNNVPIDYNISIYADLSRFGNQNSPIIYNWGISWQTSKNIWRDNFTSSLRIDKYNTKNVRIKDGSVSIIKTLYDWPMLGQNPKNTRSSPGLGPDSIVELNNLRWFGSNVGGVYKNPIIKGDKLYIASLDGMSLYEYDAKAIPVAINKKNTNVTESDRLDYEIKNTPCATDDSIIVATSSISNSEDIINLVYCFDRDDIYNYNWDDPFDYSNYDPTDSPIAYDASPVVYDDKLFLASWNGDISLLSNLYKFNISEGNNKLLCIDVDTGDLIWKATLDAPSFSTPAVSEDKVIVGCENRLGNSIFCYNHNGSLLWKANVGPIGKASPVIFDDVVYVVSKNQTKFLVNAYTKIYAIYLDNGTEKWNITVGENSHIYEKAGINTPAVANDHIYIPSLDGYLYSINLDGDVEWVTEIDKQTLPEYYLESSPTYTNGVIYLGASDGLLYAVRDDGTKIGTAGYYEEGPIKNSPIIVDGLMYYSEASNGILVCRGELKIPSGEKLTGEIVSNMIHKPSDNGYIWDKFYTNFTTENGTVIFSILNEGADDVLIEEISNGTSIDIDELNNYDAIKLRANISAAIKDGDALVNWWMVTYKSENETKFFDDSFNYSGNPPNCSIMVRNEYVGLNNTSARFKIIYANETDVQQPETGWNFTNITGINGSKENETITVDLSNYGYTAENITYLKIKFSIKDINDSEVISDWYLLYKLPDTAKPVFYHDTFIPKSRYISNTIPICTIDAQDRGIEDNITGIDNNSATYTINYVNLTNHTLNFSTSAQCSGINGTNETVTITADVSLLNFTENISKINMIKFSIMDMAGNQNTSGWIEFVNNPDTVEPVFYNKTFTPESGYIKNNTPICTIQAQDRGFENNISGINVTSAKFTLQYTIENTSYNDTFNATCSGISGTNETVTITADVSLLNFSNNITSVEKIRFSIKDIAGNQNTSKWFNLSIDEEDPISYIINVDDIEAFENIQPIYILVNATDNISGIKEVTLLYRKLPNTNWIEFNTDSTYPYEFNFTIAIYEGGEYELSTIATDNANNVEDEKDEGDKIFVFDPFEPKFINFLDDNYYEFTKDIIPEFSDIEFEDDYKLNKVEYRFNFEGTNEWTLIQDGIDQESITPTWSITQSQWDYMLEDRAYYIYFKLTDNLGNIFEETSSSNALNIIKNLKNISIYNIDISDFDQWNWNNVYKIKANVNETSVEKIQLWYSFSEDNDSDGNFSQFGGNITDGTFIWDFTADDGEGYYSFYIKVWDTQGGVHTSDIKTVHIGIFPLMELILFVVLVIIMIFVTIFLFKKIKKSKG
jgi:hypothetical protein